MNHNKSTTGMIHPLKFFENTIRRTVMISTKFFLHHNLIDFLYFPVRKLIDRRNIIKRIRKKYAKSNKVNVLFLCFFTEHWMSLDSIYQALATDERFSTQIVTLPRTTLKSLDKYEYARDNFQSISNMSYKVMSGYDWKKHKWLDVKMLKPDIIFLNSPWENIPQRYKISELSKYALCVYLPYGFFLADIPRLQFDLPFHKYLWKFFLQTKLHLKIAEKYHSDDPDRCVTLGYPKFDQYQRKETDPWKLPRNNNIKRIIWAPHWTLSGEYTHANSMFMELKDFIYDLVKSNQNIELMIKPHPGLWDNLVHLKLMKQSEIEQTKKKFSKLNNCHIYEGSNYIPYFKSSDGLILDSLSFIVEYLPTGKPIVFTGSDETHQFNSIGKEIFSSLYQTTDISYLKTLISKVIINEQDTKKKLRDEAFRSLGVNINQNVGQKIKSYMCDTLFRD